MSYLPGLDDCCLACFPKVCWAYSGGAATFFPLAVVSMAMAAGRALFCQGVVLRDSVVGWEVAGSRLEPALPPRRCAVELFFGVLFDEVPVLGFPCLVLRSPQLAFSGVVVPLVLLFLALSRVVL
ncbi:hypothetical protein NDU88_006070 [Pleurodeles waltl]|uniref:Uncharacterized protein n=1 Tax=Pleurodeles waltl TaxID=8319 RepID=A0AAV7VNW1_PLEWA|nr:hypothetical protein NDU88_006070 [Pleurodeles waltl]